MFVKDVSTVMVFGNNPKGARHELLLQKVGR